MGRKINLVYICTRFIATVEHLAMLKSEHRIGDIDFGLAGDD